LRRDLPLEDRIGAVRQRAAMFDDADHGSALRLIRHSRR
jgi:hypothetical protein